jgi:hypothetical protein
MKAVASGRIDSVRQRQLAKHCTCNRLTHIRLISRPQAKFLEQNNAARTTYRSGSFKSASVLIRSHLNAGVRRRDLFIPCAVLI